MMLRTYNVIFGNLYPLYFNPFYLHSSFFASERNAIELKNKGYAEAEKNFVIDDFAGKNICAKYGIALEAKCGEIYGKDKIEKFEEIMINRNSQFLPSEQLEGIPEFCVYGPEYWIIFDQFGSIKWQFDL